MKIIQTPSPNFNARPLPIDSIIIHYTDMPSAEAALAWLTNPASKVSAHYLIGEKGKVYQMVPEDHRAWHAGESSWQGRTNMNDCSIGIELTNLGHTHGYHPFPEAQIASLMELCLDIKKRWAVPSSRILGHSDVAPGRKQDPGHLFPWEKLAQEGLGIWPVQEEVPQSLVKRPLTRPIAQRLGDLSPCGRGCPEGAGEGFLTFLGGAEGDEAMTPEASHLAVLMLSQLGYDITSPAHTMLAFQRHFQPHKVDGAPDQETHSLLQGLLKAQEMLI